MTGCLSQVRFSRLWTSLTLKDVLCVVEQVVAGTLVQQTNHSRLGYISTCIGLIAAVEAQSVVLFMRDLGDLAAYPGRWQPEQRYCQ